jgi:hypothetical protein
MTLGLIAISLGSKAVPREGFCWVIWRQRRDLVRAAYDASCCDFLAERADLIQLDMIVRWSRLVPGAA